VQIKTISPYRQNNSPYGDKEELTHGQKIITSPVFVLQGSPDDVQKLNPLSPGGEWGFKFNGETMSEKSYSPWKNLYSTGRNGVLSAYMPTYDCQGIKTPPQAKTVLERFVMGEYINTFPFFVGVFLINMPTDKRIDCPRFDANISKIVKCFEEEHRNTGDTISLVSILPPNSSSGTINLMYKAKTHVAETGDLMFRGKSMEEKRNWIHISMEKLKNCVLCWNYVKGMKIEYLQEPDENEENRIGLILANSDLHKIIVSNYAKIVDRPDVAFNKNSWQMNMSDLVSDDVAKMLKLEKNDFIFVIPLTTNIIRKALNIASAHISSLPFANPDGYQLCLFRLDDLNWSAPCPSFSPLSSGDDSHVTIELECKFRIVTGLKKEQ